MSDDAESNRELLAEYLAESRAAFEAARLAHLDKTPPGACKAERGLYAVESILKAYEAEAEALRHVPHEIKDEGIRLYRRQLSIIASHAQRLERVRAKAAPEIALAKHGHDLARANAERGLEKVVEDLRNEIDRHKRAKPSDREDERHMKSLSSLRARAAGAMRALSFLPPTTDGA